MEKTIFGIKFDKPYYFGKDKLFKKCNVRIGKGSIVGSNTFIHANVVINENVIIGSNCRIGNFTLIREYVSIEDSTKIGSHNSIEPHAKIGINTRTQGHCMISEFSNIGDDVFLGPYFNNPADNSIGKPIGEYQPKPAIIKNGCRFGSHVVITPNNIIAKNTIVGAGSVVTKNTEENCTYYGVPSKKIKKKR